VTAALAEKHARLKALLKATRGALVAFSGGVDSALLLKVAVDVLGDHALAVTAVSPIHSPFEAEEASCLAGEIGARHRLIEVNPLADDHVAANPPERCYHCKRGLFAQLVQLAREEGLGSVVEGSNIDDRGDYRPGERALEEMGIGSPLREAGLTKAEVRELSRELGLSSWEKPPYACLATRVPYGEKLTPERLARIDAAERFLRAMGIRQVRVRDHGAIARIEAPLSDLEILARDEKRASIVSQLRSLGYDFVTLDLEGYRSGSMNVGLGPSPDSGKTS